MTTSAEQETKANAQDEARKARTKDMESREKKLNEGKSDETIGLRTFLGLTRGKNPREIQYEAFDESLPKTLPTTIAQFAEVTKAADEKELVKYLVGGYNDAMYSAASDPVAEYLNPEWDDTRKNQFRIVVRNYSSNTGTSIEDTVDIIKPGFEKAFVKEREEAGKTA